MMQWFAQAEQIRQRNELINRRQRMDLYFAQVAFLEKMPEKMNELFGLFRRLGLMKYVAGTQYVLNEVFGLEADALLCAPDEKEGRLLMKEIETGGNFGQYDKRNNVKDETFAHKALRRLTHRWRMVRFNEKCSQPLILRKGWEQVIDGI